MRLLYTLKMGFKYQAMIAAVKQDTMSQVQDVCDLKLEQLKEHGMKCLALDWDGVLAPHGIHQLEPKIMAWLKTAVACVGSDYLKIVSNNPHVDRISLFAEYFPGVEVVSGFPKKPYVDSLRYVIDSTRLKAHEVVMVDDRLLTGILAAVTIGVVPIWLNLPRVDYHQNTVKEITTRLYRQLECWWF